MRFAVYGSLKKGYHNHPVIQGANYLGTDSTKPEYSLYSLGSYPAVTKGGSTSIHLEVYETDNDSIIDRVNRLEGFISKNNPHNYYDSITIDTKYGEAEMFILRDLKTENLTLIKSGNW